MQTQTLEWSLNRSAETPTQKPDFELVDLCRDGDPHAFELLWETHRVAVFRKVYSIVGNQADAEDLTQEAFIKGYRALASFRGDSQFRTWITSIAVNLCFDHIKRNKKVKQVPIEWDLPADDKEDPERKAIVSDTQQLVRKAISELPAHHRLMLVMRDLDDMEYSEIATVLKCTVGSVKLKIFRARRQLKQKLIDMQGGPE